ncbi:hypothetical protein AB0H76_06970 [Nocardia sp. NPDC050712]|uniref:hypothetical protein n=1 Tax=Nocardia sp. NPDC050712 TaxID=3155518 RepID=UPI003406AA6A
MEITSDGALRAVHLTDFGRQLAPDALAAEIVRVQSAAVAETRKAIAAAIVAIENDPRLRALTERGTDALNQPLRTSPPPVVAPNMPDYPPAPPRPAAVPPPVEPIDRRQPSDEEEEEMDRYYQRKSWLE